MNSESTTTLKNKTESLLDCLKQLESIVVAYSGGVDSSLLAYYARLVLAERAHIVIAVSPSLANDELLAARAQAEKFNWQLIELATNEVDRLDYQRNDPLRCYFCKSTLFDELDKLAEKLNARSIVYGANLEDLKDYRPGHKAARERGVLSPLQDAQLSKEEIRELARQAGLPSWDRPQAACLSSRFPTMQPITSAELSLVDKAESFLRSLGFSLVRVRHHNQLAKIELDPLELPQLQQDAALMNRAISGLRELGYQQVELDPEGYRQGSANTFFSQTPRHDDNLAASNQSSDAPADQLPLL